MDKLKWTKFFKVLPFISVEILTWHLHLFKKIWNDFIFYKETKKKENEKKKLYKKKILPTGKNRSSLSLSFLLRYIRTGLNGANWFFSFFFRILFHPNGWVLINQKRGLDSIKLKYPIFFSMAYYATYNN